MLDSRNLALLAVLLLPAYLIRLSVFGLPTNLLEIIMAAFILTALASRRSRSEIAAFLSGHRLDLLLVAVLAASLVLSAVAGSGGLSGFGIIKGWFILPIVFSVVTAAVSDDAAQKRRILSAIYFSAIAMAGISSCFWAIGKVTYDGRLQGLYNSPNYLAMFLAPAAIIGLSRIGDSASSKIGRMSKAFRMLSFILTISALYLTLSYASWIALAVAALAMSFYRSRKARVLAVSVAIVLILAVLSQIGSEKMGAIASLSERSSLASRMMIWRSAFAILGDHWILGIGPANFQAEYLAYQKYFPPYLEWAVPHPHNHFLYIWLSSGIAGFLAFLWLMARKAKEAFDGSGQSEIDSFKRGFMVFFLVLGMIETYAKNDLSVVFWIAMFL